MSPLIGIYASEMSANLFEPAGAYDALATITLTTNTADVTFAGIPSGYKHLQIRSINRDTTTQYFSGDVYMTFNGDTGANYSLHRLYGTGSAAMVDYVINASYMLIGQLSTGSSATNIFGANVIDILDYANVNKFKTARALGGVDLNGNTDGRIMFQSGNWRNTAAITSITFKPVSGNFVANNQFALYGVK